VNKTEIPFCCRHCLTIKEEHADNNKCLYGPTSFEPLILEHMKQADAGRVKEALRVHRRHLDEQIEHLKAERKVCIEIGAQLMRQCEHKYPDGTSAWVSGFMSSQCQICGYDDL